MSGRRWGKAGVRLTDGQAQVRDRHAGAATALAQQYRAENLRVARIKWSAGLVVPDHITRALDRRGMYGPEVDEACLAREPDVDLWEAGELYPSWEQIVALARLTETQPLRFMGPPRKPLCIEETSLRFHLPPLAPGPDPIYAFSPQALTDAAALGVRT